MGQQTTNFETKLLKDCLILTQKMDRLCFPEEMWLGSEEKDLLLQHDAEATMLSLNGMVIGQAITIPEHAVTELLQETDVSFRARDKGIYSYSEAILPAYQRQGYGQLLLQEISVRMRNKGYQSISAHVRTRFGWNQIRSRKLAVTDRRIVRDFWEDPEEGVQYQRASL